MAQILLNIDGMTCMACVRAVTSALEAVDGVQQVAVSLDDGSASIDYDAARTQKAVLIAAVEDVGFDVI